MEDKNSIDQNNVESHPDTNPGETQQDSFGPPSEAGGGSNMPSSPTGGDQSKIIIAVLVLGVLVVAGVLAAVYLYKSPAAPDKNQPVRDDFAAPELTATPSPSPSPEGEEIKLDEQSTDVNTIESELSDIDLDNLDAELNQIDQELGQ